MPSQSRNRSPLLSLNERPVSCTRVPGAWLTISSLAEGRPPEEPVAIVSKAATADQVEFREIDVPDRLYPPGGSKRESWRSLFYANLVHSFISEILSDGPENEGNFEDGAHVQELINAVERSFRERRWVGIPLDADRPA